MPSNHPSGQLLHVDSRWAYVVAPPKAHGGPDESLEPRAQARTGQAQHVQFIGLSAVALAGSG